MTRLKLILGAIGAGLLAALTIAMQFFRHRATVAEHEAESERRSAEAQEAQSAQQASTAQSRATARDEAREVEREARQARDSGNRPSGSFIDRRLQDD